MKRMNGNLRCNIQTWLSDKSLHLIRSQSFVNYPSEKALMLDCYLTTKVLLRLILFGCICIFLPSLFAQKATKKHSWNQLSSEEKKKATEFCEDYKLFLRSAVTEHSSNREAIQLAKKFGFKEVSKPNDIVAGAKLIFNNRDRAVIFAVIGSESMTEGSRVIATHHDSPRIDLKAKPIIERDGFVLFKTIYYGGIKKYQWANIPLALTGRVDLKSGKTITINIGFNDADPVFVIPDAAPHSDAPLRERKYTGVFEGEELMPLIGTLPPDSSGSLSQEVLRRIQSDYGFSEEDFVSAELSLVPAMPPRDVGFDRSLIAGYGHDDRLCSYVALSSICRLSKTPTYTTLVYLTDNEETGSINNTGAQSTFLTDVIAQITEAQLGDKYSDNATRKSLRSSLVVSADVNDAVNPLFTSLSESSNSARVGNGVAIKMYGRSFNANSEVVAYIRKILDDNSIQWQTASYKVEGGGGGTIGGFMSKENMEVIDIGIPVLSMHSTYEVASKVDIWLLKRFFDAFFANR